MAPRPPAAAAAREDPAFRVPRGCHGRGMLCGAWDHWDKPGPGRGLWACWHLPAPWCYGGDGLCDHPAARGADGDGVPWQHHPWQGAGITLWATSQTCLLAAQGSSAPCSLPGPAGHGGGQAHLALTALSRHNPCPACCCPPARCPLDKTSRPCVQCRLTVRGNLSAGLPGLHLLHRGCGCAQQQREKPEGSRRAALNKHSNREKKAARNK